MSRPRTIAAGALAWCLVVVVVAVIVWTVISRAGAGLTPTATPKADATGSLPVPGLHSGSRVRPGVQLTPRPSRAVSSATPPTSSSPSSVSSSPSGTSTSGPSSSSGGPTHAPPSTTERRSWSGGPGHVVAECRGQAASLVSAYPNTGWRYQIQAEGPGSVRVHFRRLQGDDGLTVVATCVSGTPHFGVTDGATGDD